MEQFGMAAVTILVGVFGCVTFFYLSNLLLDRIYPATGPRAGANINTANRIRPWLFLLPALLLLMVYLVYPVFVSVYLSFMDATGENFVGADNYIWLVNDGKFRESMVNNLLWLVFVPAASTFFGLVAAAVTDRIRWGNFAKAMIFMPMAPAATSWLAFSVARFSKRSEKQTEKMRPVSRCTLRTSASSSSVITPGLSTMTSLP